MPFLYNVTACSAAVPNLKIKAITNMAFFLTAFPDPGQELTVQSNPLKNFLIFKDLPPEIRIAIWRAALPAPHLVNLETEAFWLRQDTTTYFPNAPPLPSALHANHESRSEAMRHYKLFWTIAYHPSRSDNLPRWANSPAPARRPTRPICIDLEHDMVASWTLDSLHLRNISNLHLSCGYAGVQKLVVDRLNFLDHWLFTEEGLPYEDTFLSGFSSLRKLVLIAGNLHLFQDTSDLGGESISRKVERYMKRLQVEDPSRSVPEVVVLPPQPMMNKLCYL